MLPDIPTVEGKIVAIISTAVFGISLLIVLRALIEAFFDDR